MKELIIKGDVEDVEKIINRIRNRYGNITIKEYLETIGKEREVLV